ncbi:hypothetical protein KAU32_07385, partial [bacterium]|nr:hypothetical protein [bacterium]
NYSYQINIKPKGPDWEYLEKNEFFGNDSEVIETLGKWYFDNPNLLGDFVSTLKSIQEMVDAIREQSGMGKAGEIGWLRNLKSWRRGFKGGCADLRLKVADVLQENKSRAEWEYKGIMRWAGIPGESKTIFRVGIAFHQANVVYPVGGDYHNGIVIDIWKNQKLNLISIGIWTKGFSWATESVED